MSEHIAKRHNKSLLLYHIVCPAKYRRKVFIKEILETIKDTCLEIAERYEIGFIEIGADNDHFHFLIQSVPNNSVTKMVMLLKSITAKEIFRIHPEIKKELWGGNIWTSGFYANTVGQYGNEKMIRNYVQQQGGEYKQIYRGQLKLFEGR